MNANEQLDFLINYLLNEDSRNINIPKDYSSKRQLLRSLMNVRMPGELSSEFIKVQDEFLTNECLNKNLTSIEDIKDVKGNMRLWQGDIVTLKVDAIVNAANSQMLGCFIPQHNCIDNVIHSAAGLELREECSKIMLEQGHEEPVGSAKITKGYNLPSKYVIHTVGPQIPHGMKPSKQDSQDLANCYKSCLDIACEYNLDSIAFCNISTGVFNYPQKEAAEIAVKTVEDYLKSADCDINVVFDVFSDESYSIYKELLF